MAVGIGHRVEDLERLVVPAHRFLPHGWEYVAAVVGTINTASAVWFDPGVRSAPESGAFAIAHDDVAALVEAADEAVYAAKAQGRNRTVFLSYRC